MIKVDKYIIICESCDLLKNGKIITDK